MNVELEKIARLLHDRIERYHLQGRTITLKIKYHDFKQITRNQSFVVGVSDYDTISNTAKNLLLKTEPENKKIRLLGISLSNFGDPKIKDANGQFELF
jgi:DNA polymerase-4